MKKHLKNIRRIFSYQEKNMKKIIEEIKKYRQESEVLAFYNPECIGIMNSTKSMFSASISLPELLNPKEIIEVAETVAYVNPKQVIFGTMAYGYKELAEYIHLQNSKIKIKFLWHGSHSMFGYRGEEHFLDQVLELAEKKVITSIGFLKESMALFYQEKGYPAYFVENGIEQLSANPKVLLPKKEGHVYVGIYSAGNRWEKNTFNQLSSVSLLNHAVVDVIPASPLVKDFCKLMNISIRDEKLTYLPRQELLNRMSQNDVNLYVTFTECSPVVPLESLEVGVPCLTGNNHHYFKNSKLASYLIVNSEDSIHEIAKKAQIAIEKKEEILELYQIWKQEYQQEVKEKFKIFMES